MLSLGKVTHGGHTLFAWAWKVKEGVLLRPCYVFADMRNAICHGTDTLYSTKDFMHFACPARSGACICSIPAGQL
jgi:hypothetical protein